MAEAAPGFEPGEGALDREPESGVRAVDGHLCDGEVASVVPLERCAERSAGSFVGSVREDRNLQALTEK